MVEPSNAGNGWSLKVKLLLCDLFMMFQGISHDEMRAVRRTLQKSLFARYQIHLGGRHDRPVFQPNFLMK